MFDTADFLPGRTPIERRADPRRRVFLQGKVLFSNSGMSNDCAVRNYSARGARITLKDAKTYPSDTILVIVKTGLAHEATTVWAQGEERGLRFDTSHDLSAGVPARLSYAYKLWIENLPR